MKKKVCMIIPSFRAKGGITSVVSGYPGSDIESEYELKFIETYTDSGIIAKLLKYGFSLVRYIYYLLFWKPDLLHIHTSFGGSFYRKKSFIDIAKLFGIPIINHIHGSYFDEFYFGASDWKKRIISKTFDKCEITIALSDAARKKLEKITDSRIEIVENYGRLNQAALAERQNRICNNTILFLGFITSKKGCFDIPEICRRVVKNNPKVVFVLAGIGNIEELKAKIGDEYIKNFVFPGWVRGEAKEQLLKDADIFLLPSYSEGMPMAVLDAMGAGLPIVSTTVGGIPGIVISGENGFLFEPGEVEKMSDALAELLTDNDLRKQMGEKSYQLIEASYSLEKHVAKVKSLYKELCG